MQIFKNIICTFTYSLPVFCQTAECEEIATFGNSPHRIISKYQCYATETTMGFTQFYLKMSTVPYLFTYVIANLTPWLRAYTPNLATGDTMRTQPQLEMTCYGSPAFLPFGAGQLPGFSGLTVSDSLTFD